ncbi:MAG TPA: quinone-dependent dihydroorotate dehydrogenase [Limnochordales bacterium]|nr:quinone-dependent dihydroorotate dehydrogenase [Limnochordales bacterium]
MGFYDCIRPLLWTMDAERAHRLAMALLRRASGRPALLARWQRRWGFSDPALAVELAGMRFQNCLGLAAGLDKDGEAVPALAALGFGFVEVGTVTPRPQPGNPGVRLWRLPAHQALINRMGFNNGGAAALARRLAAARPQVAVPIGVNIGKNRDTPAEAAAGDYARCLETVYPVADYVVVNVSSPNTPGLRGLQAAPVLAQLLAALREAQVRLAARGDSPTRPLFVKVAPDLDAAELDAIVGVCLEQGVAGLIATNTTVTRPGLAGRAAQRPGGLSGAPLFDLSTRVVAALYRRCGGRLPIIGVGGIMSAADAYAKIKAGASLVQVYTGFVYGGPGFPARLLRQLRDLLARDGFRRVADAVGVEAHRWPDP